VWAGSRARLYKLLKKSSCTTGTRYASNQWMRAVRVSLLLICWAAVDQAESAPVAARMRHVVLHMGYGVVLRIDDLRGHLESRKSGPPVFDDIDSYLVALDYAHVSMSGESLTNLMNNYVFAADDAPIKNLAISVEGSELAQSGKLKKAIPISFKMRSSISVMPDGRLRLHPTSLKAA